MQKKQLIELRSSCNIISVKQRILALAEGWWWKASKNNDDIINFTYHHQTNTNPTEYH